MVGFSLDVETGEHEGGAYPARFEGAIFVADFSRDCIWAMLPGPNGLPDPATRETVGANASSPVDIKIGPGGDVFYVDFAGGAIHRIQFG